MIALCVFNFYLHDAVANALAGAIIRIMLTHRRRKQ
jgi:hypothetical protein